jgi:hypothetical protein
MIALPLLASLLLAAPVATTCPPLGSTRADILKLRESKFEVASAEDRNALAVRLLSCLDDPDPAIRDGVVFEGLQVWLRSKALSPATILILEASLKKTLAGEPDAAGFRLPFAALVLSEVARADRVEPVFPDEVRASLVEVAASSLTRVNDYRGFDPVAGWRHGVAHGADLVLQLSLNPKVDAAGVSRLMQAVSAQIAPKGPVFYTFGEPERLARAVVFSYRRGLLEPAFWEAWFASISDPTPMASWGAAFQSLDGLARRHNALSFLHALSFAGRVGGDEAGKALAALADKAATRIMGG